MASELTITPEIQNKVNELSARLRREVILHLLKIEFADYRQSLPEKEILVYEIEQIAQLPCATKSLRGLFQDAREYRMTAGMYPAPVTLADLRYVVRKRSFGMFCNRVKFGWLVSKDDTDLRSLPSFKALVTLYEPFARAKLPIPCPKVQHEINAKMLIGAVKNATQM